MLAPIRAASGRCAGGTGGNPAAGEGRQEAVAFGVATAEQIGHQTAAQALEHRLGVRTAAAGGLAVVEKGGEQLQGPLLQPGHALAHVPGVGASQVLQALPIIGR